MLIILCVLSGLAVLALAIRIVFFGVKERTPQPLFYKLTDLALLTLFFAVLLLIVAFPFTLAALWPIFARAVRNPLIRLVAVLTLLGLAWLVYFVKQSLLEAFAIVEVVTGLLIAWGSLSVGATSTGGLIQGVALAGSVYAMITGIDDFKKARSDFKNRL